MTENFLLRMLKGKLTIEPYPQDELFKPKIPDNNIWVDQTKWKKQKNIKRK